MTRYRPALIHMVLPVLWIMSCISCTPSDEKRLLGKWQCERDWFLFKDSQTYDYAAYSEKWAELQSQIDILKEQQKEIEENGKKYERGAIPLKSYKRTYTITLNK